MKISISTLLLALLTTFAPAQGDPVLVPAAAVFKETGGQSIWLMAATDKAIRYKEAREATAFKDAKRSDLSLLYLYDPADYEAAVDLYEARKYEEALDALRQVKQRYDPIASLENSPSVMAAYYEMECLRKLGDLEGLSKALTAFEKRRLTDELKQRQLELYVLWDAMKSKSWDRLLELVAERNEIQLPPVHRAQVAYCEGVALEAVKRTQEALLSYQTVLTADAGASDVIVRKSALRILEILDADPALQAAKKAYDDSEGKSLILGYTKLLEAAGVAGLFEMSLGGGAPLPAKFEYLLKYKKEPQQPEAVEPKAAEKPAEEPAAAKAKKDEKGKPADKAKPAKK